MKLAPLALAAALALAAPAGATDLTDLTGAEREAFRAEVRAYLLENPEVLMEAIAALEAKQAQQQAMSDQQLIATNAAAIFDDGHSWIGGNPEGSLTIVEFADYRCGYCRKAHPELMQLLELDGDIRYIVKEFPILGEQSVLASRFAVAVLRTEGPEAYGAVHDALYTSFRGDVSQTALDRLADDLGLDAGAIRDEMDSDAVTDILRANSALAQQLGISGTPTFVIGDQMIRGYVPYEAMTGIVAEERG